MLGLVCGTGFATWQAVEASIERQAAVEARDEATNQAAIAQAVNEFLNEDMLAAVDPELGGRDTTVLQVLDDAAAAIEERFLGRPRVEAAIRYTLGLIVLIVSNQPTTIITTNPLGRKKALASKRRFSRS